MMYYSLAPLLHTGEQEKKALQDICVTYSNEPLTYAIYHFINLFI